MNQIVIEERIRQLRSAAKAEEFIAPTNVLFLLDQLDLAKTKIEGLQTVWEEELKYNADVLIRLNIQETENERLRTALEEIVALCPVETYLDAETRAEAYGEGFGEAQDIARRVLKGLTDAEGQ